jgi:hypothetical protein
VCPDGTSVGGTYAFENGTCVLQYICPPPQPPLDAGPGPICDPLPCPSSETFDRTKCACVAPSCQTAHDCTGPLPLVCTICDGGGFGCAHFACVSGECQMAFCD